MNNELKVWLRRWLPRWLAVNVLVFLIGYGPLALPHWTLGTLVTSVIVAIFVRWTNDDAKASRQRLVRPYRGWLDRRDGTRLALRFIETSNPNEFLAVDYDGERVTATPSEQLSVDQIGPGQVIVIDMRQDSTE